MADESSTMGLTMAVSGEKEFREALANINAALKVNTSELSLVTAQYEDNKGSIEALTAANAAIEKQIVSQAEKVRLLQEQTASYTAELGENNTKTLEWQAKLNKAQTELIGLNTALHTNASALSDAQAALAAEQTAVNAGTEAASGASDATEDYEARLRELNDIMELNDAKAELISAQYGKNADSAEALKKKTDLLKDSFGKQEQAVSELEKALAQANDKYGAGSSEVADYEKKLISAKTSLAKMGNELNDNQKQIDTSVTKSEGFKKILGELGNVIGVDLPDDLDVFTSGTADMSLAAGTAFAAVVSVAVAAEKNLQASAERVKDLVKSANEANISDQEMAALEYASEITGVTTDSMIDAFSKVSELMGKANSGNEEAQATFKRLGINIRDDVTGELRDADDVFMEIAERLGEIDDGTYRNTVAMELFGDQAKNLNSIFEDGGKLLKESMDEAWDTGIVKSQEYYDQLLEISREQARFNAQTESAWDSLALLWNNITRNVPLSVNYESLAGNAKGTDYFAGGYSRVGENGPETVYLPRGSAVSPNGQSAGGDTYVFNIDAKNVQEYNDLVRIAENKKMSIRMGKVGG